MSDLSKIAIVTDSSCDLSDAQLEQHHIHMVSLRIVCQNAEYRDRVELSQEQLYELLKSELPKTSLPLPEDVSGLYDRLAAEGITDIVHVCISSGLSGTFNMVRMIAEDYRDRMNIRVVDSLTLSTGLGLMVLAAAESLEAGDDPDTAVEKAKRVRSSQLGMFVIRTLEYLRKGGRIGLVEGVVGSLLQIKPIIYINDEGVYQTLSKARGYKAAVETMAQEVVRRFGKNRINLTVVHGQAEEEAESLLEKLKQSLSIASSFIRPVSPVLAIHTGPGLLGIVANLAE
ncbi:MAG TPA: DegV family protein [Candidatus Limiplasma sp.]|jgi:DegV family protein with EDD domain|nr:DegV family protein [Candidatus Limiplasma sp.]HPR77028.1 DegV family protein [Candidatus Limiplasma sp.]